jgi:hypothetical protein
MQFYEAIFEDFKRPLNTNFEDSIHMPQNHYIRNNRRGAASGNRAAHVISGSPTAHSIVPMWDDANGAVHDVSSSAKHWSRPTISLDEQTEAGVPWGSIWSKQPHPGPMSDISTNIEAISLSHTAQEALNRFPSAPTRTLYSKIHEQRAHCPKSPIKPKDASLNSVLSARDMRAPREELSSFKVFKGPGAVASPSSATLDRVRKMRADEQGRHTIVPETIPSTSGSVKPLHAPAKSLPDILPDARAVRTPRANSQRVSAAPPSSAESLTKEVDSLAEVVADMRISQSLVSSPSEGRAYERNSALTFDDDRIEITREDDTTEAMCVPKILQEDGNKSTESVASSCDEFERVLMPTSSETEHNGAMRKWYMKFRR